MTDKTLAHDIELPPIPKGDIAADTCPVMWVHSAEQTQAYARAAVEADRKRRGMEVDRVRELMLEACRLRDKHTAANYMASYQVSDDFIVDGILAKASIEL